ncbi:hypothetical protein MKJ01_13100 [Chryseobacterium sp. SSA4.19]|uniref:hypothetical protein n=1 Tax=Chryseobacterium sp. SSA4.19 TaxID=2919915 RepID=UPI001F4ED3A3|nr:hypothetical protein [Chryseobacterium sp. SSA4.19]MCJ8154702.1 hypothetical protein [Chryseobacterium sp. SSA4.19]
MKNSMVIFKWKSNYFILCGLMLGIFLNCSGDHPQNRKDKSSLPEVKEMKASRPKIILVYIDSVAKLPDAKFNEAGIRSLNKKFLNKLPLVMYDSLKETQGQNIVMQYHYSKKENLTTNSEMIFLIPESMTETLTVGDFTDYFGDIREQEPLIGIIKQPLPEYIDISPKRSIKLTFNNSEKRDRAGVVMISVQDNK